MGESEEVGDGEIEGERRLLMVWMEGTEESI